MVDSALDKFAGYLDKRFVLNAFFPSLIFWGAVLALIMARWGWNNALECWQGLRGETQTFLAVAAVAWVVFFASVLAVQMGTLIRLYEGFWGAWGPGKWLANLGRCYHRWQLNRLDPHDDRDFEFRYRHYPRRPEDVLPTLLGNVFKSAESYPGDEERYGMDGVFFWPRLYAVLPQAVREGLAEARAALDLMVVTSTLGWLFAVVGAIVLWLTGTEDRRLWLAAVGGGAVVGWLAYKSAVRSAVTFAELVKSAFDVYRGALRQQMGYRVPESLEAEREFWQNLGQQLYRRAASKPEALKYAPAEPAKPPQEKPL